VNQVHCFLDETARTRFVTNIAMQNLNVNAQSNIFCLGLHGYEMYKWKLSQLKQFCLVFFPHQKSAAIGETWPTQ